MTIRCQPVTLSEPRRAALPERFAILVPAYNEGRHLERLVVACCAVRPALILIVDDGSKDDTPEVLGRLVGLRDGVRIESLRNEPNLGKQGSVRRGLQRLMTEDLAGVALIDGDLQHDPAELPALAALLGEFDAVIGARSHSAMPIQRRFSNWFVNTAFRLVSGVSFVDVQSGLRLYANPVADALAVGLRQKGRFALEHESLTALARFSRGRSLRVAAAPVSCAYADEESKVGPRDIARLLFETFRQGWRFRRALRGAAPAEAPAALLESAS